MTASKGGPPPQIALAMGDVFTGSENVFTGTVHQNQSAENDNNMTEQMLAMGKQIDNRLAATQKTQEENEKAAERRFQQTLLTVNQQPEKMAATVTATVRKLQPDHYIPHGCGRDLSALLAG